MDTEIGLLFQSTIQTMSWSVLFKHVVVKGTPLNTMHAGMSVSLAVLITSVMKHQGNSAGIHMRFSQLTHCVEYYSTLLPPSRIHLSLLSFMRAGSMLVTLLPIFSYVNLMYFDGM